MALGGTNLLLAHADAAPAGDVVTKSVRFGGNQSWIRGGTGSTGSSNGTWTLSYWIKRSSLEGGGRSHPDHNFQMFYWTGLDTAESAISFQHGGTNAGKIRFHVGGGSTYFSDEVFRDLSAWAHILVSVSSGTATVKYNGETVISGATGVPTWGEYLQISRWSTDDYSSFGGYIADVYGVDGTALDSTDFTSTDETTGQLKPIAYSGSVGTEGFHLDFKDSSEIGKDVSGEGNDFTEDGGVGTWDIVPDNPSAGMNYATLNPLQVGVGTNGDAPENGNLKVASGSYTRKAYSSTIGANSGKFYAEVYDVGDSYPMVSVSDVNKWVANSSNGQIKGDGSVAYDIKAAGGGGEYYINSASGDGGLSITPAAGDIIMIAFDADTRKVWYGRNGTWNDGGYGTGNPSAGTNEVGTVSGTDDLVVVVRAEGTDMHCNFGQEPSFDNNKTSGADTSQSEFYYAPPTGFSALSTGNLPTPTIVKPSGHFNTVTYSGNSPSDNDIDTVGFQPDLTWIKCRNLSAHDHAVYDSVRGATKQLQSNTTNTESTVSEGLKSWFSGLDGDGFTVGSNGDANDGVGTLVAWNWMGGSTATNENYNATAGFSIIKWTGNASDDSTQERPHSLEVAPELIIAKNRTDEAGGTGSWIVYHKDLTSGYNLLLNDTAGEYQPDSPLIENVDSNSVDFGNDSMSFTQAEYLNYESSDPPPPGEDPPADDYVAYLFASVAGYSKVGSFSGSSSVFIYTDFRPAFILAKRSDSTGGNWLMFDDKREGYNVDNDDLEANDNAVEATTDHIDILSNGFKIRTSDADLNAGTVIYLAVAKNPFKYASAR